MRTSTSKELCLSRSPGIHRTTGYILTASARLETNCATLEEAKAIAQKWHRERYADNEAEFIESGGNTADTEEVDRKRWSGKFKCRDCSVRDRADFCPQEWG